MNPLINSIEFRSDKSSSACWLSNGVCDAFGERLWRGLSIWYQYEWYSSWKCKCRDEDISTFRDYSYTFKYTGTKATKPSISFMKNKDDSFESFRNQSNEETKFQNTVSVVTGILENHIAHSCSIRQNFFPAASWSPMSNDRFSTFF